MHFECSWKGFKTIFGTAFQFFTPLFETLELIWKDTHLIKRSYDDFKIPVELFTEGVIFNKKTNYSSHREFLIKINRVLFIDDINTIFRFTVLQKFHYLISVYLLKQNISSSQLTFVFSKR